MRVEIAKQRDLSTVIDLHIKSAEEFDFSIYPEIDRNEIVGHTLRKWAEAPLFILIENDEIVGFAGTEIERFYWSKEEYLSDYRVYIKPEYRSMKAAKLLYGAIKDFANKHDLPLHIMHIGMERIKGRERLMRALGFRQTGFYLSYEGENGKKRRRCRSRYERNGGGD